MSTINLGLVTSGSAGWKTVRERWERDLSEFSPKMHHVEDHARLVSRLTERYGAKSVGHALAGCSAVRAALDDGATVVLLSTLQNAPFVPLRRDVVYVVYGDCTTAQLARLYGGKTLGFPGSWIARRFRRLSDHGCYFLCMSDWYRNALRDEFSVPEERLVHLPFYVDTEKWKPLTDKPTKLRRQALFVGADLDRKGGDIVYALAGREEFRNVDFHVVSPRAQPGPENLHIHRSFKPDSSDLIRLTAECDFLILPTRADTSSIAALEADACGVPTIITGLGGIPEIVLDGATGSVVAEPSIELFARELSTYISNPEMTKRRGWSARRHIERNFSTPRHMGTLRDVISRAAAEAETRRGDRRG
jgi:glycosyltransferase involved in cell wall biosynthesis